jgi:hypothetical protein
VSYSTSAVRDTAGGSRNRTTIKGLFKAALKAITQRDDDAPQPRTRRRGEKEGGGPILMRLFPRPAGRPAARGRYATLRAGAATPHLAQGGHEAQAALYLSDTLDWLKLWHDNADHWPDDDFNAKQDRYFPQP